MAIFYNLFRCFTKDIIIDNITYHKLFCYIFTVDGIFLGIHQKNNSEEVDTMAIHPDANFCCCCCCFKLDYN